MAIAKVTEAELEVMRVIWQKEEPSPLSEIREKLAMTHNWKPTTVKTHLYNLRDKGVIEETQRGTYRAIVTEKEATIDATRKLINRIFESSAKKLVASLIDSGELSQGELSDLREMLTSSMEVDMEVDYD